MAKLTKQITLMQQATALIPALVQSTTHAEVGHDLKNLTFHHQAVFFFLNC